VKGEILIQPKLFAGIEVNAEFDTFQARVGPELIMEGDVQGGACLSTVGSKGTTSDALLAELGWTPYLRADTLVLSKAVGAGYNNRLEPEQILAFKDLLQGLGGSSSLTPAVSGPPKVKPGQSATYNIKMPACYPYTEAVTYQVAWTGGAPPPVAAKTCTIGKQPGEATCTFDPKKDLTLMFAWPQASATNYTITVGALDGGLVGRKFTSAKPATVSVAVAAK
jgi:hypothetical protein